MPATTTHIPPTDCRLIELRQYTLHPGQREVLVELFEREFVETQEAVGITVMGQFRDLDNADRFTWLRGFRDMAARLAGLSAFYGGPTWQAHRKAANATMVDSDNVLLLRPAWPGAGMSMAGRSRAVPGATALPAGLLEVCIFHLHEPAVAELLDLCRSDAPALAWYVTEPGPNNFPRLPVREGEHVLVRLAMLGAPVARDVEGEAPPDLARWLARPIECLHLQPTVRSALHA
ncbi:MAG TPA: NIPSNAP family protein [Rhizobacter sp.]|nr:NIPSNAP family protein [Rhizobacter sp.]